MCVNNYKSSTIIDWEKKKKKLRSNHRPLEFVLSEKRITQSHDIEKILKWTIRLMTFWFWYRICQGKLNPTHECIIYIAVLQRSQNVTFEDAFLHWVEADILSLGRMSAKTIQDSVLKSITSREKKNISGSIAEWPNKKIRCKLTIENDGVWFVMVI